MTIMELRDQVRERHRLAVGCGTMWRFLARHGITRKKKTGLAAEQDREDVASAREEWFESELDLDPEKLVFIDETRVSTNMARRFGRAPRGERCRASVPFGYWKTTTLIAALRVDRIGVLDGRSFLTYVEQVLAPTLRAGVIMVLDNVSTHKVVGVREAIEAKGGRVLYLPPYSAGLQSDRKVLLEDQDRSPAYRCQHCRCARRGGRPGPPMRHAEQMLELLRGIRP